MSNKKLLVFRDTTGGGLHDVVRPGDTLVDEADNGRFILGITPRLNLPEYNHPTPQDGDLWKYNDKLWIRMSGITHRIRMTPEP